MSLIDTVPTGAEGTAAPAAQTELNDDRSAAAAFEGLLDWEEQGEAGASDTESAADEAAETGPEETPTPEEDEGQSEPQDDAPATIEPPQSMTAEEKAAFSKLPPEAQQFLARRDSEQRALLTKRTEEIADQRKAYDTQRQAIEGQSKQYLDSLHTMLRLAVPEAEQFAQITDGQWQQLSVSDPAKYVQLRAARDSLAERVGKVQAEMQRVDQEQAQAQDARRGEFLAEQKAQLVKKVPEFGDPAKAAALTKDLNTFLAGAGFTPQEIGMAADHRLIVLAREAMLYRQAEAARKTADAKRNNNPPRVQQPNAAPERGDGKAKTIREMRANLARTGSTRDAAALFMEILP